MKEKPAAVAIGVFLMSKTWSSVCNPVESEEVFAIMDSRKHGYLEVNDVRKLLIRMGNPVAASASFDYTLGAMKAKDVPKFEHLRTKTWWPKCCGAITPSDKGWVEHDSISLLEFEAWCTDNRKHF